MLRLYLHGSIVTRVSSVMLFRSMVVVSSGDASEHVDIRSTVPGSPLWVTVSSSEDSEA